jgi:hypothetical protein
MRIWPTKKCLEENKIYFETIAATLLSIMAILLSCFQGCLAQKEYSILVQNEAVQKTVNWGVLRNTIWQTQEMYPWQGKPAFIIRNNLQLNNWAKRMLYLLNKEIDNPALIINKKCLKHWRRAISRLELLKDTNLYENNNDNEPNEVHDYVVNDVYIIRKDIDFVYAVLISASDEPQATKSIYMSEKRENDQRERHKKRAKKKLEEDL